MKNIPKKQFQITKLNSEKLADLTINYKLSNFSPGNPLKSEMDIEIKLKGFNIQPDNLSLTCLVYENITGVSANINILDFIIQMNLRSYGIGSFVWSIIYELINKELKCPIYITGTLAKKDAKTICDQKARNKFWLKIMDTESSLICDSSGDGNFFGKLIDPLKNDDRKPKVLFKEIK